MPTIPHGSRHAHLTLDGRRGGSTARRGLYAVTGGGGELQSSSGRVPRGDAKGQVGG